MNRLRQIGRLLKTLWSYRRWAYAVYMLIAVIRIPARTGFHIYSPTCDLRLTMENAALSMTKIPHIVLFGFFFLLTLIQFDKWDGRAFAWSFIATLGMGALVELEEGATRTGYCRMTDVLPDAVGALIVMAVILAIQFMYRGLLALRK